LNVSNGSRLLTMLLPSPTDALREGLRTHPDAWLLAANLFLNLNVNEPEPAREAVEMAKKLKGRALEIAKRTGLSRNTVRTWLRQSEVVEPKYHKRRLGRALKFGPWAQYLESAILADGHLYDEIF